MKKDTLIDLIGNSIHSNWELSAFTDYNATTLSYKDCATTILKLHDLFEKVGIQKGDKIALLGHNRSNWATIFLATVTYGAVIVPIIPDFSTDDYHHILQHSDSKLLFISKNENKIAEITAESELIGVISITNFAVLKDNKNGLLTDAVDESGLQKSNANSQLTPGNFLLQPISLDDLALISYTNGAEGFSKGVMLTHRSLWSNAQVGWDSNSGLVPGDKIVSFLPLAHAYGCLFEFLAPFVMGCHITFLTDNPSAHTIVEAFKSVKPKVVLAVPLIVEKLYRKQIRPVIEQYKYKLMLAIPFIKTRVHKRLNEKLSNVFGANFNEIIIGGAALNKEIESFLKQIKFRYTVGYGMTECGPLISYANWKNHQKYSSGKIVARMSARIANPDSKTKIGEIEVSGANVMVGYYKNRLATNQTFTSDGWLKTGDLGYMDKENNLFITGRCKSMILGASGQNVYPEVLESKLGNIPYTKECLVRGVGDNIEALIYPDYKASERAGVAPEMVRKSIVDSKIEFNKTIPGFMHISIITIVDSPFEKDSDNNIKRFLYQKI